MSGAGGLVLKHYRDNYNSLSSDVDGAFGQLLLHGEYKRVIHEGLTIIQRHAVADFLGVFLLHRHFAATPKTIFLERRMRPPVAGHHTILVTAPTSMSRIPARMTPHRFRINRQGILQPLEFTSDRVAIKAWGRLQKKKLLLRNVGQHLARGGFSRLLGLGIYTRQAAVKSATRVYLEETDFEAKKSVVHILPSLPRVPGRLVPTLWTIQDAGNGCCTQACIAYCSHPPGARIGYCGHRDGGHVGCV